MYAVSYDDLLGSVSAEKQLYDVKDLSSDHLMISSPSVGYDLSGVTVSSFGTENYYAKIISLLPNLLLSEKSRLLTAIAQSMTEEVEVHVKGMKSQSLKVNQNDIIFPSEEEYNNSLKEFIQYATAKHFSSNGQKWTREDMHER